MRKLFKIVTSRLIWSALLILIEFFLMVYLVFWAAYARGYYIYFYLLSIRQLVAGRVGNNERKVTVGQIRRKRVNFQRALFRIVDERNVERCMPRIAAEVFILRCDEEREIS